MKEVTRKKTLTDKQRDKIFCKLKEIDGCFDAINRIIIKVDHITKPYNTKEENFILDCMFLASRNGKLLREDKAFNKNPKELPEQFTRPYKRKVKGRLFS